MIPTRRCLLLAPLLLSACGGDGPARSFQAPAYGFLTPLRLNVGSIEFGDPPPAGPLDADNPLPPGPALRRLVEDRLSAGGSGGKASVRIEEARITRNGGTLEGAFGIRVEASDGSRSAFTEARVARTSSGFGRDLRGALYDMTRQMLDDMNVELEFQVRRSLRDYLQATADAAPAPGAVQRQDLSAPAGNPAPPPRAAGRPAS